MLLGRRFRPRRQRRRPSVRLHFAFLLAAFAVALVAAGASNARPPSTEAASIPTGPFVTNVTATSFAVSWITDTPSGGYVKYGTESGRYPSRADDERGASYVGYTHLVRITGLLGANTKYYYSVVSGDSTLDSPSNYYVITGQTAASSSEFLVNGFINKTDGSEAAGALVYVFPQRQDNQNTPSSMTWLAVLTGSDGSFSIDVGAARAATNTAKTVGGGFGALTAVDHVRYRSIGGIGAGGGPNDTGWQRQDLTQTILDAGKIELDPLALPLTEQPTPSPSATPTLSPTPSPTLSPTPTAPVTTPTSPATAAPTRTPTVQPAAPATTATIRPTQPLELVAPAVPPATAPTAAPTTAASAGIPPTTATPRAAPRDQAALSAPVASATRPRQSSPTARPSSAPASPTPISLGAPLPSEDLPESLQVLLLVAASLLLGGFALATIGVVQSLRRRAA